MPHKTEGIIYWSQTDNQVCFIIRLTSFLPMSKIKFSTLSYENNDKTKLITPIKARTIYEVY